MEKLSNKKFSSHFNLNHLSFRTIKLKLFNRNTVFGIIHLEILYV